MPSNNNIYKMSNAGGFKSLNRYYDMLAGNAAFDPASFESIATITAPSGAAVFTSIPATFQHLQIRYLVRGVRSFSSEQLYIRVNGDGANNYAYHYVYGDGSGVAAGNGTSGSVFLMQQFPAANENANIYASGVIDFLDYANTNKNTTMRGLGGYDNNNSGVVNSTLWFSSGLWINTAAINSISVLSNGNFASPSTFALYGMKG
jgi:hypothetical protein